EIARARQAVAELARPAAFALPQAADGVPVATVPLRPADGEVADLVAALADVPGLGDDLDLAEAGRVVDRGEEAGETVHFVELARQRGGQIEAKAVDVHLRRPVPE